MSPASGEAMASPAHHPDLDREVATLSTKLINAINHQTTLDDNLSATRMELDNARERIRQLERQVEEQREMLAGDVWVKRKSVEMEKTKLLGKVADEKKARQDVEQQKKKIEQELENLTAALFEEANKMVVKAKEEARLEQEALHRKNDQLKAQLADTEGLLASQQEQLAELKHVMEQMSAERDELSPPTVPPSPGFSNFDAVREEERLSADGVHQHRHQHSHHRGPSELSLPSYPTSFTHILQPVLRTDLASYNDFKDLIRTSKRLSGQRAMPPPPTSISTGALTTLGSLGVGLGSAGSHITNGSTTSLSTVGTPPTSTPQTPVTPASTASTGSSTVAGSAPLLPALKETEFYKRVLKEDIEPTLRLDLATGLSFFSKRSVMSAMTDGSLVVEPIPSSSSSTGRFSRAVIRPELYPCSLCGEQRKEEEYLRTHRFRTSDSGSQGYPLCRYCLARVRSTCDFLGFLRLVKDGLWRAEGEDAERAAWMESVRLREQMFWARVGGGVVPLCPGEGVASVRGERSPRPSQEVEEREKVEEMAEAEIALLERMNREVEGLAAEAVGHSLGDVPKPAEHEVSKSVDPVDDKLAVNETPGSLPVTAEDPERTVTATPVPQTTTVEALGTEQTFGPELTSPAPEKEVAQRLSLTIPGSA